MITVESVESLIESSRPRAGFMRGGRLSLFGLAILLVALFAGPDLLGDYGPLGMVLLQVIVFSMVGSVMWSSFKQRRQARLMLESFEAVQLREWDRAEGALFSLLGHPVKHPQARAESLLALSAVTEARHAYEAAQQIYESLLAESHADPIQLHTAQVALAAVMLRTGQISDAVNLIDRLARQELPGPLLAQVELLSLFREVTMGQAAEGLEHAERRRELFRDYLSTRAGYGYGLLAAAYDKADRLDGARKYWHDATLLVRPSELVERFSELKPIAGKYPATERIL